MPPPLPQVYLHVVFSTRNRTPFLKNPEMRLQLQEYLPSVCERLETPAFGVGVLIDHMHLAINLGKKISLEDFVRELKRDAVKWIKKQDQNAFKLFHWQTNYFAFSVSPSHLAMLTQNIATQEEFHAKDTFQQELRHLCQRYGIKLDERAAWL